MGGLAIKNAMPIRGDFAGLIGNAIVSKISKGLNINCSVLGSTGKKSAQQLSGDIDIAIELLWNTDNIKKLDTFIKESYGNLETNILSGLKIYSIGFTYNEGDNVKIVQVDFMFVNDIEYAKFIYHSPNYIKNESKYKGLFRTNLLAIIASNTPLDSKTYPVEYFENTDIVKDKWKYSLNYTDGLKIVHKSYIGKKGKPVKNPVTIKEDDIFISNNRDKIIHILFGNKATSDDINSFETIINFICSPKYKYRSSNLLQNIFKDFFEDVRHTKYPDVLEELKEYIKNILKENKITCN